MAGSSKKHVAYVKFIGDEEVGEHILRINEKKRGSPRKRSTNRLELSDSFKKSLMEEKSEEAVDRSCKVLLKPLCLNEDQEEEEGKEKVSFKTRKTRSQTNKASSVAATPSNDKKLSQATSKGSIRKLLIENKKTDDDGGGDDGFFNKALKTPLRRSSKVNKESQQLINQDSSYESTPKMKLFDKSKTSQGKVNEAEETPRHGYELRRMKKTIAKIVEESSDEFVSSSSDSESTQSKEENNEESEIPKLYPSKDALVSTTDDYFLAQGIKTPGTSNRTLSRLDVPQLDLTSLQEMLRKLPCSHQKEKKMLFNEYKNNFEEWMFQLSEGFNLLLYGLGSKRQLILDFQDSMLSDKTCIVINGFFPNITVKTILTTIIEEALELECKTQNPQDQLDVIKKALVNSKSDSDLYILFHNIDGVMLRSVKAQNILSHLAEIPLVHIIASVDHVNAPLVWSQAMLSRFNWIWYDTTTFASYIEEISFENSLLIQQSGKLVLSSLSHVFNSLTPNAKGIFLLLVRYQLDQKDNNTYIGMSFQECYQKCREAFLVNSDLTLRAQLTEFRDHKLIRSKKGADGMEYLLIPLDMSTLTEFLEDEENK